MNAPICLNLAEAEERTIAVLVGAGTRTDIARSVAHALVLAEADGHGGHGLVRLASYAAQVRVGKIDGQAIPEVTQTLPGAIRVDAMHGFAYPALDRVVERLLLLTPEQGVAVAGVFRSGHCGAMSLVVERLARAGLIGMMVANTPAAMAPWGGRRALFGTNPIACAFPFEDDPVVIDLSLSKVARGHILAAQRRGEAIPEGWARGPDGEATTDPTLALAGTMVPVADAKGAALALMVETLAAGLTGAHYAAEASSFLDTAGPPPATGQLVVAIAPAACGGSTDHLAHLFHDVAAEPGARLPGLSRFVARRRAEREGIKVDPGWFSMAG
ncbi:Ldh family oxidoreductase [Acidiphilium sp. AL]|uniref:Ldh family oxidoreductase n=1 Tax=Acidiphilium sp. AL TaxID=2871704 RepID=UPI0021CB6690|nr:Ldh family oxidoreductase [Acidiphilium sp. AL]MCU4161221.1 Ldh family oxidoreductase [Acidiphilium sp. AL]